MSTRIHLDCGPCVLRPWRRGDEAALIRHANNRALWKNLRDRFPHPYTRADADGWVAHASSASGPPLNLAIEVEGEAAGSIGLIPGTDIERYSAEVGYWLGEAHWGKGIASAALASFSTWTFETLPFIRLFALPFATNLGSRRVLEKAGYSHEGTLRSHAVKDGQVLDMALYARLHPEGARAPALRAAP